MVAAYREDLEEFVRYITERAERIDQSEAGNVAVELEAFVGDWAASAAVLSRYWSDFAPRSSLMISAEKAAELKARYGGYHFRAQPTPNSMRNVEPGTLFKLKEQIQ